MFWTSISIGIWRVDKDDGDLGSPMIRKRQKQQPKQKIMS